MKHILRMFKRGFLTSVKACCGGRQNLPPSGPKVRNHINGCLNREKNIDGFIFTFL